ncbi:unnamed protein product [Calypogeia fissa]
MNGAGDLMMGDASGSKGKGKNFQHPTYAHLIHDAISSLKQRGGSSAIAIRKNIEQKMGPVLGPNYKKIVGSTLSKLAKSGKLIKTGNTFKLSPEFKQEQLRRRRRHRHKGHHKKKRRRRRRRRRRGKKGHHKHKRRRRRRRRRRRGRKGKKKHRRQRHRRRRSHSPKKHHRRRRRRRRRRRSRSHSRHRGRSHAAGPHSPSKRAVEELND